MSVHLKHALNNVNINATTLSAGGYTIYEGLKPIYVGYAPHGVRERLYAHVQGVGSADLLTAVKMGRPLEFICVEGQSALQVSRDLIHDLTAPEFTKLNSQCLSVDRFPV